MCVTMFVTQVITQIKKIYTYKIVITLKYYKTFSCLQVFER